jgi:DNA invertase Pin-like site-specific DNA recombinase
LPFQISLADDNLVEGVRKTGGSSLRLVLHQQGLDTGTPTGRAMFQMLGVFAEFERAIIQERVKSGLKRAKARGVKLGRPGADPKTADAVRKALKGESVRAVAKRFGLGVATIQRIKEAA